MPQPKLIGKELNVNTPQGTLTEAQAEIMSAIWDRGRGVTIVELWETLSKEKQVARTTVQTMMTRLEKRGWLRSEMDGKTKIFYPTRSREEMSGQMADQFVNSLFSGSVSKLVMNLLGQNRVDADEIKRLRNLLDDAGEDTK